MLFTVFLFILPARETAFSAPVNRDEAWGYLQEAIHALRQAELSRARSLLRLGKRKAADIMSQPAALKLEAILFFLSGDLNAAQAGFTAAFNRQPTAGLAYFLGNYFMEQRRFTKAGHYFERAARLFERPAKISRQKALINDPAYALTPMLCPKNAEEVLENFKGNWVEHFRKKKSAPLLWDLLSQSINRRQAALAVYQAYIFLSKDRKNLQPLLANITGPLTDSDLSRLLAEPENDDAHRICIFRLRRISQQLGKKIIKSGAFQTKRQKKFVERYLLQAYQNRMFVLATTKTAYAYGAYLLKDRNFLTALHVLRYALELLGTNVHELQKKRSEILDLQQILYTLRSVYKYLGRSGDAGGLGKILDLIDTQALASYLIDPKDQNWIPMFLSLCKTSRYNREALLFLISHAEHTNSPRLNFYRQELARRDRLFEDKELSAGFSYLRRP